MNGVLESVGVEWSVIRGAFIRMRGSRTQTEIAAAGKLEQSAISKLENNDNLGPAVGVFVKAIEGLGLRPSEFFAQLEGGQRPSADVATVLKHVAQTSAPTEGVEHGRLGAALSGGLEAALLHELSDRYLALSAALEKAATRTRMDQERRGAPPRPDRTVPRPRRKGSRGR